MPGFTLFRLFPKGVSLSLLRALYYTAQIAGERI